MQKKDKVLSMLGLAMRARKAVSGEFSVEKLVRDHRAFLVIIADDASANTKKAFRDLCAFHKVPYCFYADKDSLGHALGQQLRASVGVSDEGFAAAIQKELLLAGKLSMDDDPKVEV